MESESSSNSSSCDEADRFLEASDEIFYDCFSTHFYSDYVNSSPSENSSTILPWKPSFSVMDMDSSSSSGKWSTVEINDELSLRDFRTIEQDVDVTGSGNNQIEQFPKKEDDFEVIDSCEESEKNLDVTSGQDQVDPFQNASNGERGEDNVEPGPSSTNWSLLGLAIRSIEIQVNLMISFIKFPSWFISSCLAFVFDPYGTVRRGRRYLLSRVAELCDLWLKDHKLVLEVVCRLAWGLFWAVYVGIILCALLISAFMISGFVITHLAHEPLVIKELLNFDYTKNSPEAYVPITSCAGIGFDSICKESFLTGKIRGLKVNPPNHRTTIIISMTLPESEYNRNLGMFQVRVDFLATSGQILASSRQPCMVRFRSEPIRLVQTFLKIAPLVTGYVSEIQTLNLKLKGFAEKDIVHTACLKVVIEQRAEFRPGAGIPEIYDASLFLKSELPFVKRIIWNWRRTLFVWISMGLFIIELLFVLGFCILLIIPRTGQSTQQRDRTLDSNLHCQTGST